MKPIGLTYKSDEELMLVHLCLNCGKISCNRIAGDDNPYTITCLLDTFQAIDSKIHSQLTHHGIQLLNRKDEQDVLTILYGNG